MTTIKLRRDTATNLSNANPILAEGEACYDLTNKVLKVGDGVTAYNELPSISGGDTPSSVVEKYGIMGDYATHYGIIDCPKGLVTYTTATKDVVVQPSIVLLAPGNETKTTIASEIEYSITSSEDVVLFYIEGEIIEVHTQDVFYQTNEPDNGETSYIAWYNPEVGKWQFKSNDTGNVFREAIATPIANVKITDDVIVRIDYAGYRLLDDSILVDKTELETIVADLQSLINNKQDSFEVSQPLILEKHTTNNTKGMILSDDASLCYTPTSDDGYNYVTYSSIGLGSGSYSSTDWSEDPLAYYIDVPYSIGRVFKHNNFYNSRLLVGHKDATGFFYPIMQVAGGNEMWVIGENTNPTFSNSSASFSWSGSIEACSGQQVTKNKYMDYYFQLCKVTDELYAYTHYGNGSIDLRQRVSNLSVIEKLKKINTIRIIPLVDTGYGAFGTPSKPYSINDFGIYELNNTELYTLEEGLDLGENLLKFGETSENNILGVDDTVTLKGNTFNNANELVQLDSEGYLPVLDGRNLVNLPGYTETEIDEMLAKKQDILTPGEGIHLETLPSSFELNTDIVTLVGSPSINDGIAGPFSNSNYIKLPTSANYLAPNCYYELCFDIDTNYTGSNPQTIWSFQKFACLEVTSGNQLMSYNYQYSSGVNTNIVLTPNQYYTVRYHIEGTNTAVYELKGEDGNYTEIARFDDSTVTSPSGESRVGNHSTVSTNPGSNIHIDLLKSNITLPDNTTPSFFAYDYSAKDIISAEVTLNDLNKKQDQLITSEGLEIIDGGLVENWQSPLGTSVTPPGEIGYGNHTGVPFYPYGNTTIDVDKFEFNGYFRFNGNALEYVNKACSYLGSTVLFGIQSGSSSPSNPYIIIGNNNLDKSILNLSSGWKEILPQLTFDNINKKITGNIYIYSDGFAALQNTIPIDLTYEASLTRVSGLFYLQVDEVNSTTSFVNKTSRNDETIDFIKIPDVKLLNLDLTADILANMGLITSAVLEQPSVPTYDGTNVTIPSGTKVAIPNGKDNKGRPQSIIVTTSSDLTINQATTPAHIGIKSDGTIYQTGWTIVVGKLPETSTQYYWYYDPTTNKTYQGGANGVFNEIPILFLIHYYTPDASTTNYFNYLVPISYSQNIINSGFNT